MVSAAGSSEKNNAPPTEHSTAQHSTARHDTTRHVTTRHDTRHDTTPNTSLQLCGSRHRVGRRAAQTVWGNLARCRATVLDNLLLPLVAVLLMMEPRPRLMSRRRRRSYLPLAVMPTRRWRLRRSVALCRHARLVRHQCPLMTRRRRASQLRETMRRKEKRCGGRSIASILKALAFTASLILETTSTTLTSLGTRGPPQAALMTLAVPCRQRETPQ